MNREKKNGKNIGTGTYFLKEKKELKGVMLRKKIIKIKGNERKGKKESI